MSELRRDPLSGQWVVLAAERSQRPNAFVAAPWQSQRDDRCPFCPGRETETPPELLREPPDGDWQVRVVPNKFPAFIPPISDDSQGGFFARRPATGAHEVIIESSQHFDRLTQMPLAAVEVVVQVYARRLAALRKQPDLRYGLVFKNTGPAAGASLEHIHSQCVALDKVPSDIKIQVRRQQAYLERHGKTLLGEMVRREHQERSRWLADESNVVAFCPFASRTPYEIWLLPREGQPHFDCESTENLLATARLLHRLLRALECRMPGLAYNMILHTAPWDVPPDSGLCRWRIEVLPRLSRWAGFELGTQQYINTIPPEAAADQLRCGLE